MDNHASPCKPAFTALSGPEVISTRDQGEENGGSARFTRQSNRQRIKKFLLRSTSMGRELWTKEKRGDSPSAEAVRKPNILRRLSFGSAGSKPSGQCSEGKEVSTAGRMTLVRYHPECCFAWAMGSKPPCM